MKSASQVKLDLLAWTPVRAALRWSGVPVVFQVAARAGSEAAAVLFTAVLTAWSWPGL